MLEEKRVAALGGIEDVNADGALKRNENDGDGNDWSSENHEHTGRIMRPDKERHAEPRHARCAHAMDGDDEVEAREDGAEAGDKGRESSSNHVGVDIVRGERGGECPARINAAADHGVDGESAADHVEIPTEQIDFREG